ncbi:MAG: S-methyl-5-thioribose-1-phosphate isomerase [Planctomycetaceae bacterium]|jgi:methylthioribose-1-phosphate isomerase|nr:S-methyl-5-thioribose-1-phosphate isomerase [Planctomycetaceae bacterium]
MSIETLSWVGGVSDGFLRLIDQTLLPIELRTIDCRNTESVWEAIKQLRVRGAPAIGIAAAYGMIIGIQNVTVNSLEKRFYDVAQYLASSRPTAVNLFWAIDRMKRCYESVKIKLHNGGAEEHTMILNELFLEARKIHEEDRAICRAIGNYGQSIIMNGDTFITHCNAGGLATADYGTALAVFFTAAELGKKIMVYADETRPLLQGARLTAWELMQKGINVTLICDSMAAMIMRQGKVNGVIVGADRIAANGDTANKIGTYGLAVSAFVHNIPFYVAAPISTFDLALADGVDIPIEERNADEICCGFGVRTAPEGVNVYNPAFDVTPAKFISAIITERGIINPVNKENIENLAAD